MKLTVPLTVLFLALPVGADTPAVDRLRDFDIHCMRPDDYAAPISDIEVSAKTPGADGQLALVARPDEVVRLGTGYRGMRLLLVNRTKERATLLGYDSMLKLLVQEALDEHRQWKPIEKEGCFGFCGNGLRQFCLEPGRYWELAAPRYVGPFKTKLRFRLRAFSPSPVSVHSNEFDGSIDPLQFTKAPPR
jgi:hypothetical protein